MEINTQNIVRFRQDINKDIDDYIEFLQNNTVDNQNNTFSSLIPKVFTHYERMKRMCMISNLTSGSNDEDSDVYESDFDFDSDDKCELFHNRVYNNSIINKQLLGLNDVDDFDNTDDMDDFLSDDEFVPGESYGLDSSNDPVDYIESSDQSLNVCTELNNITDESDTDTDFIIHSKKQIFKLADPNSEIIITNNKINYDDPVI